jgi:hypothetical protein
MHNGKRVLLFAFALALVFVDRAHDRGQDTRVPSATRAPKTESRAGETHIGGDTGRGGEDLLLADREKLLLSLQVLVISVLVTLLLLRLLLLQWKWWWL